MLSTEELWEDYHTSLERFFRTRLSPDTAEDLLQELFVNVHLYLSKEPSIENPKSWLFQCARNLLTDHYRKNVNRELSLTEEVADVPGDSVSEDKRALAACLEPFIHKLPRQYASALKDSAIDREPQREIADRQGSSLSAVKSRVLRAKLMLRKSLNDCCLIEKNRRGEFVAFMPREKSSPSCCQ